MVFDLIPRRIFRKRIISVFESSIRKFSKVEADEIRFEADEISFEAVEVFCTAKPLFLMSPEVNVWY